MSVAFARAVIDGLRYNGVHVRLEPGWERRGNGQSFPAAGPDGELTHHTGAPYDGGLNILIHGRSDLPGPLCNSSGWANGDISIIAAHPANHAGAAGGSWARPFPDTRNFNRLVWGHEVMYPGFKPWTAAQYRSARILAAVVLGIRRRGVEWARAHYETSTSGKWDPGIGNGRAEWFPMGRFRREIGDALKEDDVAAADVWDYQVPDPYPNAKPKKTSMLLGWAATHAALAKEQTIAARQQIAGLAAAVDKLADAVGQQQGADADEIKAAVRQAIEESVLDVDITVAGPGEEVPKA